MSIISNLTTELQGLQKRDPKLYDIVSRLVTRVEELESEVYPLVRQSLIREVTQVAIAPPIDVLVILTPTTINLKWAPGDSNSREYEVRRGGDWETAEYIVTTMATDIHITPKAGTPQIFLIKAVDANGNRSINTSIAIAEIVMPGNPAIEIEVIDNNVLMRWLVPQSSFDIKLYEVYKDDTLVGYREGTFTTYFERAAGVYRYGVLAVDIAGNRGPVSEILATVNQPPDFILVDTHISEFSGDKFKFVTLDDPYLVAP